MPRRRLEAKRRRPARRAARLALRVAFLVVLATVAVVLPWRWIDPPTTAFVLRARAERGAGRVHQRWAPWRSLSPHLAVAVVAAEDQTFPTHLGFDLRQIVVAAREGGDRPRGASTITQQVAKNLYLWPGRSVVRKGIEAWLTLWIEILWPKRRILEVYLNVAEFGPGVFGAAAASERFFGKSPRALTRREAALLAAVLPSPRRMSAADPSEYVRERATEIEADARALGGVRYLAGL